MPYLRSYVRQMGDSLVALVEQMIRSRWPRPYRFSNLFYGFFLSALLFALVEPTAESIGFDPSPPTGITVSEAIERHAPEMRFHPEERYFPSSVAWFLERAAVETFDGAVRPTVTDASSDPLAALAPQGTEATASGPGERLIIAPEADRDHVRAGHLESARTYVHTRKVAEGSGAVDIQYWVFFPYSGPVMDGPAGGAHEGDWEHITVRTTSSRRDIEAVYFAAHDAEGRWVPSGQLRRTDDDRPVVYTARYGHASYPDAGLQSRGLLPADRTADGGARWQTWRALEVVAEEGRPTERHRWLEFAGTWGQTGSPFGSPQSPLHQEYWRK